MTTELQQKLGALALALFALVGGAIAKKWAESLVDLWKRMSDAPGRIDTNEADIKRIESKLTQIDDNARKALTVANACHDDCEDQARKISNINGRLGIVE